MKMDWSRTSEDYEKFRPGPPESLYERLRALGIGLPDQRILDLGTGTGLLARKLASQGARVTGIDPADGQIESARRLAQYAGLEIDFHVRSAEDTGLPTGSFDVVTASQCWFYFDVTRAVKEVKRLLAPNGRLVTTHFNYMPRLDPTAHATEELIRRHNPDWTGYDWGFRVPPNPKWNEGHFTVCGMFFYDEEIPFTRESWRGRMRACRGVAATLPKEATEAFDREHAALLEKIVPERFTIVHRIDAHILSPEAMPMRSPR